MSKKILLWIGEEKRHPIKRDRNFDLVMDSVINYYNDEAPRLPYNAGKLFLDNGAYTANMQGLTLDVDRVIFVQETLDPTQTIPLDYPFKAGMSASQMMKLWEKTANNILYWQSSTTLTGLVPPLHAWDKDSLIKNLLWLRKHADAEYLALGSVVNSNFSNFRGFFGDRQPTRELIDMISLSLESIREHTDFKVHLMGFGSSPLMLHIGYYLGIDSTDSSGYRRKAAYGKIILPGTGERYVGNTSAKFGRLSLSPEELEVLRSCECPVCKLNQDLLWSDWKARAIHNEYVIKQERRKAQALLELGLETYETYLDKIFEKSSLKFLWEYTKLRRKYHRISHVLFGKR